CVGVVLIAAILESAWCSTAAGQTLDERLRSEPVDTLVRDARTLGDPRRGAILFHQDTLGCAKCHSVTEPDKADLNLGPNLTTLKQRSRSTDGDVVESILKPSAYLREGFETTRLLLADGRLLTGIKVSGDANSELLLRDSSTRQELRVPAGDIDEIIPATQSIMPEGMVNALQTREQFLDLVRYVLEIRDGGVARAKTLQPPPHLVSLQLPEYESRLDHASLLRDLDQTAFERGERIFSRVCQNCHGTVQQPGSLPTALRFAEGKFRNGNDPYSMYRTLTHGFGLMVPQTWMVPQQKYDVIHYVRETFLKSHNPSQFLPITDAYLASLPTGDTRGPDPVEFAPWSDMNYGPWMFNTIEAGNDGNNIAYKGLAIRLDRGPGGVSKGNQWILFDHDTMRVAAGWTHTSQSDARFIDWQGIHFDGRHQAHPHLVGEQLFGNPNGPGWANPATGSFDDSDRVEGRDGKRYGPLPRPWAKYHGLYQSHDEPIVAYRIGDMEVRERFAGFPLPSSQSTNATTQRTPSPQSVFLRTFELAATSQSHTLLVATAENDQQHVASVSETLVKFAPSASSGDDSDVGERAELHGTFTGSGWLEVDTPPTINMATEDFTLTARIQTKQDGTIFCNTSPTNKWAPNGMVVFLRGGRLAYDIGWVGVLQSNRRIDDGKWHEVALVWRKKSKLAELFVDGKSVGKRELATKQPLERSVLRIGYGAPNFPNPTAFLGSIQNVKFYQRALDTDELIASRPSTDSLRGHWLGESDVRSATTEQPLPTTPLRFVSSNEPRRSPSPVIQCGLIGDTKDCRFLQQGNRLCLTIPPSESPRQLSVWISSSDTPHTIQAVDALARSVVESTVIPERQPQMPAAVPLWPEVLPVPVQRGEFNEHGFAIDTLAAPATNPWLARLRLSGLDFFSDGDRVAVSTWDGDIYEVSGLRQVDKASASDTAVATLVWRRIASGLFQPLGVKIVDDTVYVTCRDQIAILRDSNGDGTIDFYECFNNDHQVTEHFHEFAMGLQRDEAGNFYYAKSARHALPALVPHHGTLLRVTPDGSRTEILAVGFRAANGVCLNPDGTFIVTDQEGHWNPKNRINWVRPGGFYGNMYGYHNITDESDDAMQPPLCWITNAFDRSPSELLWVPPDRWGNLAGTLLNLSYGYGKVFTVPHEHLPGGDRVQGGMCELPIGQFPTGTMRGRFSPFDDQLYVCGLFAWGSSQQSREGGLFRIRYRGHDATMPVKAVATKGRMELTFSDPLDPQIAADIDRFALKAWDLKRSKNYGSPHINEHVVAVNAVTLSADRKTLILAVPDLHPTWCYELRCRLRSSEGYDFDRIVHGTIHELP
ncbi:MAG: c-type cytochrome, partial [Planctomycetales bacterium]|nr:c-type cytochrome [Planctomycetales bacterium]